MHYTIYLVSGLNPVFFTAEQDDPSKGITLTSEGLPELKQMIDDTLGRAKKLKINMWQGKLGGRCSLMWAGSRSIWTVNGHATNMRIY